MGINNSYLTGALRKILLSAGKRPDIAIEENRTGAESSIEWFSTVKIKGAIQVNCRTVQSIIGAFEMAMIKERTLSADERT
jgi:hypothetical protein